MSYDLLADLELDTGTERLSIHGTRTSDGVYEALLTDISDLLREIQPGGGISPVQSGSFSIRDAKGDWKKKLGGTTFKRRVITLSLANRATGDSDTVFVGIIQEVLSEKELVTIDFRDDSFDVLEEALTLKVFPDIFSDMPGTTPVELIPIVLGTIDSTSFNSVGHIPAYLVDPKETLSVYRYVAAQHPLKSITRVCREGELVDPGDYTVSYANITTPEHGVVRMTFIDFNREQRTKGGDRDALISYDATGMTDDNLETGTLITDPAEALQALLELRGVVVTADFDATLVAAATTSYATTAITAGAILAESGDTYLDVIDRFSESYNLQFFRTRAGKFGMRFDNAAAGTSSIEYFDDQTILDDSLEVGPPEDSASTWEFEYAHDAARNQPTARNSFNDSAEQTALGRDVRIETETPYLRDINQALKVHEIKSFQARSGRHLTQVIVPPEPTLELGEYVKLTHFAGPESDGLGYRAKMFQVIALGLRYDEGLYHELQLIDAPGLMISSPADSEETRSSQNLPPPTSEIFSDIVWVADDRDTVSWGSHDIKLVGGGDEIEYTSVASGSTGNMASGVQMYVYFDPEVNTAALQTTTDFKVATQPGRWLMAICLEAPTSTEIALIDNRVGFVTVNSVDVVGQTGGDQLPDDTIRTRHLVAGSVTTTELTATAIDGMTITGALFRTAEFGQRGEWDSTSLRAIDSGGFTRVRIPNSNDKIEFFDDAGGLVSELSGLTAKIFQWIPGSDDDISLQIGKTGATNLSWEDIVVETKDGIDLRSNDGVGNSSLLIGVLGYSFSIGGTVRFRCRDTEVYAITGGTIGTPTISSDTVIVAQKSGSAGDNAGMSIVAGATGNSILNFGDTADENVGRFDYDHNLDECAAYANNGESFRFDEANFLPGADDGRNFGSSSKGWSNSYQYRNWVKDGISTPGTVSGWASIYVDSGDGDLKVKFGNGFVATLAADS